MKKITVESALSGVGRRITKADVLWYERTFTLPKNWKGKDVLLHFGAVDWHAEVYVNDVLVGEHKGGYDPFSFDITPYLRKSGRQTLEVKVIDASDNSCQPRGKQCLIARSIWYTPVSGIWQTVWLEPVASARVENYYVVSNVDAATMSFDVAAKVSDGDVVKTKEMGFNMIRKHIKVEPARWYYHCDRHGIMVWQDMPCIGDNHKKQLPVRDKEIQDAFRNKWTRDSFFGGTDCKVPQYGKDNYYREWTNIINAFKCFQCIVVWVPFNEAWGQFDTPAVAKYTKKLDPTRLVNAASGGNFDMSEGLEGMGDILDVHHYPCPAMNVFERKLVNVIGEYGGIGLPVEGHTWNIERKWGYGGNFFDGSTVGKYGRTLNYRESVVFETQKYPDTPHHAHFPSTLLNPGEKYTHTCIYKFSVK